MAAVRAGLTAITQRGAAQTPAKAETVSNRASLPLPAGSRVEVTPPASAALVSSQRDTPAAGAAWSVTLPSPSVLSVETVSERATAPQAYAPPAPPSPSDLADGRAVWLYRIALLVGAVAFIFGAKYGWDFVMWGGGAIVAGSGVCLFFQQHPIASGIIIAGAVVAGCGVFLWHTKLKPKAGAFTEPQAEFRK